ncbi:hypothetical protein HDU98_002394 [Podochytrium sp. JEL0797]|nr:hypothetical protein HDU98_002394 [Podochytrium sp. JEL0797]
MHTRLTKLIGTSHPIVIPPMAFVSTPRLVANASHAGCLAFLAAGYATDPTVIRKQIQALESARTWGVGFIVWMLERSDVLFEETLKHDPPCLWFSFGDPTRFITRARQVCKKGVKVFVQVQTVEEAVSASNQYGADVVVVQGREAGGHGVGDTGSVMTMVPMVVDAVGSKVLVLAAGGIMDERQLIASLMLGADGVVMGTRFVVCHESAMHDLAKKRILVAGEGGKSTTRTHLYNDLRKQDWPSKYDFRVLNNKATQKGERSKMDTSEFRNLQSQYDVAAGKERKVDADFDFLAVAAGEGVGLVHEISSVAEVVAKIAKEVQLILGKAKL